MKSQFAGIILFSIILVFIISFGHINSMVFNDSGSTVGPENLMLTTPTYYVGGAFAVVGNEGTSVEDAWIDISTAMTGLSGVNGYILYVAAGTYNESMVLSSSGAIAQKNEIIAQGTVTLNPTSANYVIEISDKSNIKISGFSISSSDYDGIYIHGNSDDIELDSITISSIGSSGICSGINVAGSVVSSPDSVQITNCTIDGDTYGINVNNSCTDIDIINNEISSCDSTGINISNNCEFITIEDNSIDSCAVAGIFVESSCDTGSIHGNTISLGTCTYGIKINSSCDTWYITNNDIDITDGTYGIYLDTISNPYIVNNMIDGNYSSAIVYDKDSANFTMNYNTLRNQTEYVNMKGYHGYRTVSDLTYLVASFHNNIISLPTTNYGYAMYIEGNSSYWIPDSYSDISNNLYYNGAYCGFTDNFARSTLSNWQSALGDDYDDNSLRVDPKLTSASDMHLQSTSPCFGTGAPISSITTDFDGNDRNSTNPNIGADEFDSITVGNGEEITISWDQVKIDAIIDAGGIINLIGPASGIDINFSTLTVNGDLVVDGTVLVKADTFNVGSTGEVQVGDLETEIRALTMTIASGGLVTADGAGFAAGLGDGAGGTSPNGGGGGAYAGDGATGGASANGGAGGLSSSITEDYTFYYPDQYQGSGGGNGSGTTGGNGGGVIHIEVFGTLTLNGAITADGDDGKSGESAGETGAGGGSGGGVFIFAETLSGTGAITAEGGAGGDGYGVGSDGGGAGGGGIVTIYPSNNTFSGSISVNKGTKANGCFDSAEDGLLNINKMLPNTKMCPCADPHYAIAPGLAGNDQINYPDLGLITEYQLTYLNFNDNIGRNFIMYYGSKNGIQRNVGASFTEKDRLSNNYYSVGTSIGRFDDSVNLSISPASSDGWTHSFNENLEIDGTEIVYILQCGQSVVYYDHDNDNIFTAAPFYGSVGKITYDSSNNEYVHEDSFGNRRIFDSNGLWHLYSDCNGNTMTLNYDGSNRLEYVEYPDGRALKINYSLGTEISSVQCYESVVSNTPTGLISDAGETNFTYSNEKLTEAGKWDFEYDASNGMLKKQKLEYDTSKFHTTEYTINDNGECTNIMDSSSHSVVFTQDKLNHETVLVDRNSNSWQCNWDPLKNVLTETEDPLGNQWNFVSDDNRNLTQLTTPAYNDSNYFTIYEYAYDSKNNLTSHKIIDSNNSANYLYNSYIYDEYNNLVSEKGQYYGATSGSNFDKTEIQYNYNCDGTISSSGTSVTGSNTKFTVDLIVGGTFISNGEMREIVSISSDTVCQIDAPFTTSLSGETFTSSRRLLKQIKTQISSTPDYFTVDFTYNLAGQVLSIVSENGEADQLETRYSFYSASNFNNGEFKGMISSVTKENGSYDFTTSFRYTAEGFNQEIVRPDGLTTQNIFNRLGEVVYTCTDPSNEKLGSCIEYYDDGSVVSIKKGVFSSWNLTSPTFDTSSDYQQIWFQYDELGNLLAMKDRLNLGVVYTYNDNELEAKAMTGEVLNFDTSSVGINESKAYSKVEYQYLGNDDLYEVKTKLDSATDATVNYSYYPNGSIKQVIGPKYNSSNNMMHKYQYDFAGRLIKLYGTTNGSTYNIDTEYHYDNFGNIDWIEDEENIRTAFTYDEYSDNLVNVRIDPSNKNLTTSYSYNDYGLLLKTIYADQSTSGEKVYEYYNYDDLGRLTQNYISDSDSAPFSCGVNRTEFSYDDANGGRLYKQTTYDINDSTNVDIEYYFDTVGRIKAVCNDPANLKEGVVYTFDSLSRIEKVEEVEYTNFSTSSYTVSDTLRTLATEYDLAGRVTKSILNPTTSPTSRLEDITTFYGYDELSNVVKIVDPKQWFDAGRDSDEKFTEYVFDNASRLQEIIAHIGTGGNTSKSLVKFEYNENSSLRKKRYTQDNTTWHDVNYDYHSTGWLKSVEYPVSDGFSDVYEYSYYNNGLLASYSVDNTEIKAYTYDTAGRLSAVEENESGNYDKQFTYNDRSQVTTFKDASSIERYAVVYDSYGRISSATDKTENVFSNNNKTISYGYYKSGHRKEMNVDNSLYKISYQYDNAGRLNQVNRWDGAEYDRLATYSYNKMGQRSGYTRYDDTGTNVVAHTEYEYLDEIGWLQKIDNRNQIAEAGSTSFSKYYFYETTPGDSHDLLGNRQYIEDKDGNYKEYAYDDLYRLNSETYKNSGGVQQAKYEFTYDDIGNRLTQKRYTTSGSLTNNIEYTYNYANQLTELHDFTDIYKTAETKAIQYTYDNSGNLTDKNIDINPTIGDYQYTDEIWDYAYDADNHLIGVDKDSNDIADYVFNELGNRVEKYVHADTKTTKMIYDGYDCVADYDNSDQIQRYFITPMLDENLLVHDNTGDDADHYYLQDGQNSVVNIIDASQNIEFTQDYEGFGTTKSSTGAGVSDNRFTYTGREFDAESGLYYYRARMYDSTVGSFNGRDPMPYTNLYPYVNGNPINATDPFGLMRKRKPRRWTDEELIETARKEGDLELIEKIKKSQKEDEENKQFLEDMQKQTKKMFKELEDHLVKEELYKVAKEKQRFIDQQVKEQQNDARNLRWANRAKDTAGYLLFFDFFYETYEGNYLEAVDNLTLDIISVGVARKFSKLAEKYRNLYELGKSLRARWGTAVGAESTSVGVRSAVVGARSLAKKTSKKVIFTRSIKSAIKPPKCRGNLRVRGLKSMGLLKNPPKTQFHHCLPWQFRLYFARFGINVNDLKWGKLLEGKLHRTIHKKGYNLEWADFLFNRFKDGFSEMDVYKFLKQLMKTYGF